MRTRAPQQIGLNRERLLSVVRSGLDGYGSVYNNDFGLLRHDIHVALHYINTLEAGRREQTDAPVKQDTRRI